jgi:hypothetical protein
VRITATVEVDVPCVIAFMFEEGVNVLHSVLSKHVNNDFALLINAWISVRSLGSPCPPSNTPIVWGFSDCGVNVGSYADYVFLLEILS